MSRSLPAKFKPHIGRVFLLRKCETIPSYDCPKATWRQNQQFLDRASMLGDAVLVMDETNTRVNVIMTTGGTCWIQKYYLHKEIQSQCLAQKDEQVEMVSSLLILSKKIKSNEKLTQADAKTLDNICVSYRNMIDYVYGLKQ